MKDYLSKTGFTILNEDIFNIHPSLNRDKTTNYFTSFKPKNIVIYDSYNNPFFPYKNIIFDKATFDLPKYHRFLEKQFGIKLQFLPFHFYFEFVSNDYYLLNTRPFLMKPLIQGANIENFNKLEQSIHICVLGDTNSDIYDKSLYRKLNSLLKHLFLIFRWGKLSKTKILTLNLGKNFYYDKIFVS